MKYFYLYFGKEDVLNFLLFLLSESLCRFEIVWIYVLSFYLNMVNFWKLFFFIKD